MNNYAKGANKERKIVNEARKLGLIAFRSAGSHSPIDVCAIDTRINKIYFIQCKPEGFNGDKLEKKYKELNGFFEVSFRVK
jgi:Holliday junction resolvase